MTTLAPQRSSCFFDCDILQLSAVISAAVLVGVGIAVWSTRWGIGLTPDSIMYVGVAQGLRNHRGIGMGSIDGWYNTVVTYMPGTSVLYAGAALLGLKMLSAARLVTLACFAANITLAGMIVFFAGQRNIWRAGAAALLLGLSPSILQVHIYAWSEPPFMTLTLLGMAALALGLARQRRSWLVAAALALGLSYLTRYAGLGYIAAGGISILLFSSGPVKRRILDAALYGGIGVIPVLGWMLRNHLLSTPIVGRPVAWYGVAWSRWARAGVSSGAWFVPETLHTPQLKWLLPLSFVVAAAAAFLYARNAKRLSATPTSATAPFLTKIFVVAGLFYLLLVMTTMLFFDPQVRFDPRIMMPLLPLLIIGGFVWCPASRWANRWTGAIAVALVAYLVPIYVVDDINVGSAARRDGLGFASPTWKHSATLDAVRKLPLTRPLYSNAWDAVLTQTGRYAPLAAYDNKLLPEQRQQSIETKMAAIISCLRDHDGVLILFNKPPARTSLFSLAEIKNRMPLKRLKQCSDGTLYVWDASSGK